MMMMMTRITMIVRILKQSNWNEYPMTQQVINTVNKWGEDSNKTEYGVIWSLRIALERILIGTLNMT